MPGQRQREGNRRSLHCPYDYAQGPIEDRLAVLVAEWMGKVQAG
jgi:hypothetical protein